MIIFFTRASNDIDHNAPIIYKMAETSKEEIKIFALEFGLPIKSDYRLEMLRERFGIECEYIYKAFTPTWLHKMTASVLCGVIDQGKGEGRVHYWIRRLYTKYLHRHVFNSLIKRFVFSKKWAKAFLEAHKPSALVFDWIKMHQLISDHLFHAAHELNIPTIAAPPGIPMFTNDLHSSTLVSTGVPIQYGETYNHFDHFVVQFKHLKDVATRTGLPEEKVHILGSTRFCNEWQQIHEGMVSHTRSKYELGGEDKLKVVYMDTLSVFRINVDTVIESLQKLSQMNGLQLLLKPHTRSNRISNMEIGAAARVVANVPSGVLCDWADVIIGTSSSILLEAYRLNKVLLYPKFFHENTMLFEQYGACWQVNTQEELEAAIRQLMQNPSYRPYSDQQVEDLLTEVVCGGVEQRDVLGDYSKFILDVAHRN